MKRISFVLFIVILLLSVLPAVSYGQNGLHATVTQKVWLRVGPGTEWRKLTVMPVGMTINLDGRTDDGLWVRGINSDSEIGWVAGRFLSVSLEEIFSLPVIYREDPITVSAPAPGVIVEDPVPEPESDEAAPAPAAPSGGGVTATATANVNMRSGPGTDWRRVGGVSAGNPINIDGRDYSGNWVRGINSSGEVGWVSATYVSLSYDQVLALPAINRDAPFSLAAPGGGGSTASADTAPPAAGINIQPVVSTAPVRGFAYGGHVADWSESATNWMRVAGMTWVKRQIRYQHGQDPNQYAGMIADAHARGFRILLGVVGLGWQLNNGGYQEDYGRFVGGLAALGADAIEVWNEPNIDREWPAGQINPASYTQLLAVAYNHIKSNNSNTLVVSGAPAPTGFFGGCSGAGCDDAFFVSGMAQAGAGNFMDCIGAHYNEGIIGPNQTSGDPRSEHYTRYFWGMLNTYHAAFGGSKPVCFTELGYLSPEGYGPLPGHFGWAENTTVGQQALWLDQAVSLSRSSGRVRLLIIWNVDFKEYGADPMAGYAMIRPDGSCPACNALGN